MTIHTDELSETALVQWHALCRVEDLLPERGTAALVGGTGGIQVAVFRAHEGDLYALSNLDPFSDAQVMARGIVGSRGDAPTVASPMYKQVFDLRDGRCLDGMGKDPVDLPSYAVLVRDGVVHVALSDSAEPSEDP